MRIKWREGEEPSVDLRKALAIATALLRHAHESMGTRAEGLFFARASDISPYYKKFSSRRCLHAEDFPYALYLGAGAYGAAFAVYGTDLVARLSVCQNDGGAGYHAACFRGAIKSPLAPRILAIGRHKGFTCTIMPRYHALCDDDGEPFEGHYERDVEIISSAVGDRKPYCYDDEVMELSGEDAILYRKAWMLGRQIDRVGLGGSEDVHIGNVMIDPSTGQYVVTDPVCSIY